MQLVNLAFGTLAVIWGRLVGRTCARYKLGWEISKRGCLLTTNPYFRFKDTLRALRLQYDRRKILHNPDLGPSTQVASNLCLVNTSSDSANKPPRLLKRQKVLLSAVQALGDLAMPLMGDQAQPLRLQYLLFLFSIGRSRAGLKPSYHFAPTTDGPISFELMGDLRALATMEQIDGETLQLTGETNWTLELEPGDPERLGKLAETVRAQEPEETLREILKAHPYYGIHAPARHDLLEAQEIEAIEAERVIRTEPLLVTLGYEGRHLEEFLNILIGEDIRILVDVRKNAYSMKYGFSRHTLEPACLAVRIKYLHMPGLGVDPALRHAAKTDTEWQKMFDRYEREILPEHGQELARIMDLVEKLGRVAITCYERDPIECHRSRVSKALQDFSGWGYSILHL